MLSKKCSQAPPSPTWWWKELWGRRRQGLFPPVLKGWSWASGEEPPSLYFIALPGLIAAS